MRPLRSNNPVARAIASVFIMASFAALPLAACSDGDGGITLGSEAQVFVTPTVLAFPDVPRGETARLNVEVRHTGTGGVIRLSPELVTDSPDLSIGLVERETLAPGEVVRIQIVYASNNDAPDLGTLVIRHNIVRNPETRVAISTPGQRARLFASPQVMDFGIVQAAAPATLDLRVINGGTAPARLTGFSAEGRDATDFTVIIPPDTVVPVDGEATVQVRYSPTGRNKDTADLTLLTEREDVTLVVPVRGEEETPVLTVSPSLVQLGWTRPREVAARELTIKNEGNTNLDIARIVLEDAPSVLTLTNRPNAAFSLRPGQSFQMGVVFSPVDAIPMTENPLGTIRFESSDAARNPYLVPIYGAAGDPSIIVIPEAVVDFAFVAEGYTGKRSVVVVNVGAGPIDITAARLVDASTDEFTFVNPEVLPRTLNSGESVELQLTFANEGGADGREFAKFFINTSDPVVPTYPLDVVAGRAQRPTCEAAFVPDLLAMGAFRPGEKGLGKLVVMNTGSGNCEYREHEFDACLATPFGVGTQFTCDDRFAFNPFRIVSSPGPRALLGPGEQLTFEFEFTAPPNVSALGRESYYARLMVLLFDPNSSALRFVAPPGGVGRGVNLRAESAVPLVAVDPRIMDFGTVRTDCASEVRQVRVRAEGPIDARVTRVETVGCEGAVRVSGPPVPATVRGFSAIYYDVQYAPDLPVPVECVLRIENDSYNLPVVDIALAGQGTDVTRHVDRFIQVPAPKVDLLFVVDDSFSMGDDQERLRQELPRVLAIATTWGQDYHVGITTTDTVLVKGNFKGFPRYADTSTPVAEFAENLVVGTAGHYIEMGLEAAYLALYNRSARTDLVCQDGVPNQCPRNDGEGIPLICVDSQCSGRNYGFMREDAELVIVIVSDEEDSSPQTVGWYVNRFADLKKPQSGVGVVMHSIVVTPAGCLAGFGTPGQRYVQASEALGGAVVSICAPDFGLEFERVALRTFGLKDRFYPSLPPDPATMTVRVRGETCTAGWSYNYATGAVVLDEEGPCYPQFDEPIEIEYDVLCAVPDN